MPPDALWKDAFVFGQFAVAAPQAGSISRDSKPKYRD
jgi:hypothetical protein